MTTDPVKLDVVDDLKAMEHAIWESDTCIGQWAFCASLAMLRKAIDLWSRRYSTQPWMRLDRAKGEKNDLRWRLIRIAENNSIYAESIHDIMDGLRVSGNASLHDPTACLGNAPVSFDAAVNATAREPFLSLQGKVAALISGTNASWTPTYSDPTAWRGVPAPVAAPIVAPQASNRAVRLRKFLIRNTAELSSILGGYGQMIERLGPSGKVDSDPRFQRIDERVAEFQEERRNLDDLGDDSMAERLKKTYDDIRMTTIPRLKKKLQQTYEYPDLQPRINDPQAKLQYRPEAENLQRLGKLFALFSQQLKDGV